MKNAAPVVAIIVIRVMLLFALGVESSVCDGGPLGVIFGVDEVGNEDEYLNGEDDGIVLG